jgi:hypothetical protein
MAYLKGHNLGSANIPKLKYTAGTSIIIFGEGNKIDYSLARKNQIVVNGQTLAIPADAAFSDAVKKIQGAMNRSTSQSLIFPMNLISQAYAAGTESEAATAAVGILSTRAVCPELEDQSSEPCPFKSDADYLKDRSIRQQGANIEVLTIGLKCEGDKFASSTTRVTGPGMPGMIEKTTLVYDKDGTEKIIRNDVAGGVYCEMKVKDGGFDSITYDATGSDGCNFGSTDNGKIRTPGNGFQKGDKIQRMGGMNLPLRRLRSCCKSDECKAQMNIYIAENLNKNSGSKAKQNTPAPVQ